MVQPLIHFRLRVVFAFQHYARSFLSVGDVLLNRCKRDSKSVNIVLFIT